MNLYYIFYNFISADILELNLESLENLCYRLSENSAGRNISNKGGWQSNDLDHNLSELKEILNKIQSKLDALCNEFNLKNVIIDNVWLNLNRTNSFNTTHNHPYSVFSGVFYIKSTGHSGNLVLKNPNELLEYHIDKKYIDKQNGFNSSNWTIEPESGKLVIFPSWLNHEVEPNLSNNDRISLSFNSRFV